MIAIASPSRRVVVVPSSPLELDHHRAYSRPDNHRLIVSSSFLALSLQLIFVSYMTMASFRVSVSLFLIFVVLW